MNFKTQLKSALVATIPVMTGYLVLGFGFGVILATKGYGILWALGMSLFIYAGSMQFVAIDLITGGAGIITTALTTLMVNARHLFYGISMVEKYKSAGAKKPYLIFALTDETYSLLCAEQVTEENRRAFHTRSFLISLFDQIWWVTGSVIGSMAGAHLPFSTEGIDFALTALFVTVFVEQWLSTKRHLPALIGVGVSALCLVIFSADVFLIPSMILITVSLMLMRGREAADV
ncbi:MAG: AzlC family ABC transporter permease [Clostridia bacterium]|nr:AzlC family ABC transporter permease [Clostridia bacterium]